MTDRFEQDIADWYKNSRTVNLEYLNLEENKTVKLSVLQNNISVIYDKLLLFAKISIRRFHQVLDNQKKLQLRLETCEELLKKTQSETKQSLTQISTEIHKQPKLAEEDLKLQVQRVESLLHEIKTLLIS